MGIFMGYASLPEGNIFQLYVIGQNGTIVNMIVDSHIPWPTESS